MTDDDGGAPDPELEQLLAGRPFMTLDDVADALATSRAQIYAMVRRKELRALKLGGRGQWRVAPEDLAAFVAKAYADTEAFIDDHPFDPDQDDD